MALKDATAADFEEGRVIGPNEVICRLSKRAFIALRGDAFVVLKKLAVEHAGVADLQQHAELLAKLNHPNLARVYGCDETSDGVFWVTELVAGATLGELRAACKKAGKSLPLGVTFAAIHEAALVLGELHDRKRSHGDVRDSNIIVGFGGHARVLEPGVLDSIKRLPPDPRGDVLALATLLYECLTGSVPDGPAFALPSSCNHALEKSVDDLIVRAIGPDRGRHFKTGAEFAKALKSAAGAYFWKVARRGELVSSLFKERRAHLAQRVSNAAPRLEELRVKRAAQLAAEQEASRQAARQAALAAEQARKAPPPPPAFMQEPQSSEDDDDDVPNLPYRPAPEIYSAPRRAVMGGFGAMVGIAACVFLVNALSGDRAPLGGASAAVLAPPIPVMVQVKPPEPPVPAEATAAAAQAAPAQKVEAAGEAPPESAQKKRAARKKKPVRADDEGDAPLPPWLTK